MPNGERLPNEVLESLLHYAESIQNSNVRQLAAELWQRRAADARVQASAEEALRAHEGDERVYGSGYDIEPPPGAVFKLGWEEGHAAVEAELASYRAYFRDRDEASRKAEAELERLQDPDRFETISKTVEREIVRLWGGQSFATLSMLQHAVMLAFAYSSGAVDLSVAPSVIDDEVERRMRHTNSVWVKSQDLVKSAESSAAVFEDGPRPGEDAKAAEDRPEQEAPSVHARVVAIQAEAAKLRARIEELRKRSLPLFEVEELLDHGALRNGEMTAQLSHSAHWRTVSLPYVLEQYRDVLAALETLTSDAAREEERHEPSLEFWIQQIRHGWSAGEIDGGYMRCAEELYRAALAVELGRGSVVLSLTGEEMNLAHYALNDYLEDPEPELGEGDIALIRAVRTKLRAACALLPEET